MPTKTPKPKPKGAGEAQPPKPPKPEKLAAKLLAAVHEVDHVEKDGTNTFHKYRYTSAEAIYRALREPLLSRGLLLLPSAVDLSQTTNDEGTTAALVRLEVVITDTASDERVTFEWFGEGRDAGDKAAYKAFTGGLKTFLRHLFMLPADDDPEADEGTDQRAAKRKTRGGAPLPSKAQKGFLEKLVKGLGFNATTEPTFEMAMAWAESLTGGEDGTMSKALDFLADKKRDKPPKVTWVREKVLNWAKAQSDLPGADSFAAEREQDLADGEGFTEGDPAPLGDPGKPDDQPSLLDEDAKAEAEGDALSGGPYDPEYGD